MDGTYSWIHSDLVPPNLLVRDGRLQAVLDSGAAGLGGPPRTSTRPGASSMRNPAESSGAWWTPTTTPGATVTASRSARQSVGPVLRVTNPVLAR